MRSTVAISLIGLLVAAIGRAQTSPEPGQSVVIRPRTILDQDPLVAQPPSFCNPAPTGLPALPASLVLPTVPQSCAIPVYPANYSSTVAVNTFADLQAALNAAQCGTRIVVTAGVTYIGNLIVPSTRCPASNRILVESSAIAMLKQWAVPARALAGTKRFPALSSNSSAATMAVSDNSAGWYFVGLEFTADPIAKNMYPIIAMGEQTTSIAALPHDITFDRCLIHPAPCPANGVCNYVQRGITLDAVNGTVIFSNIWGIVAPGMDTQGIMAYNSPGPFLIAYNDVEASGENIMFNTECPQSGYGPGVWGIPDCVVPSDGTITHNHLIKQRAWRSLPVGCDPNKYQCYNVKNSFEIKHGQRMLVDSNWFDTTYASGQAEFLIENCFATGPYVCQDLTVTSNLFEHGPEIAAIAGNGNFQTGQRVLFRNNVAVDISGVNWGGSGLSFQLQNTNGFISDHNTIINQPVLYMNGLAFSDAPPSSDKNFRWTNNIQYGSPFANAMSAGATLAALPSPAIANAAFVGDPWPNLSEMYNTYGTPAYPSAWNIYTPRSSAIPVTGQPGCSWNNKPLLPCWPLDWVVVGFTDFNGGNAGTNLPGLVLGPSSPYRGKGTDSMDLGANVSAVMKAVNVTNRRRALHYSPDTVQK
jgi:hypothetical protein